MSDILKVRLQLNYGTTAERTALTATAKEREPFFDTDLVTLFVHRAGTWHPAVPAAAAAGSTLLLRGRFQSGGTTASTWAITVPGGATGTRLPIGSILTEVNDCWDATNLRFVAPGAGNDVAQWTPWDLLSVGTVRVLGNVAASAEAAYFSFNSSAGATQLMWGSPDGGVYDGVSKTKFTSRKRFPYTQYFSLASAATITFDAVDMASLANPVEARGLIEVWKI